MVYLSLESLKHYSMLVIWLIDKILIPCFQDSETCRLKWCSIPWQPLINWNKTDVQLRILDTCDLRSFTQDSKGYSKDFKLLDSSSNCLAPATIKARSILKDSILCFQSALSLFKTAWILFNSSSRALPEKMVTFFTSSKAAMNDSSSTAPACPPPKRNDMN